jgi:hypothetical protein
VSKVHSVAAALYLQFVLQLVVSHVKYVLYFARVLSELF